MSGGQRIPEDSRAPEGTMSRILFYTVYGSVFFLLVLGPAYFGEWIFKPYEDALDWAPNGGAHAVGIVAVGLLSRCAPFRWGWRGALPGFLAAVTVDLLLFVQAIAVTVVLWALFPDTVTGIGGWTVAFMLAFTLTLPMILGAIRLSERWHAADLPWHEWFRNRNFRHQTGLGVFLGFLSIAPVMLATAGIEYWLLAAYPAAEKFAFVPDIALSLAVLFTLTGMAPFDLRSALRSAAAALVVFETGIAANVAVTLAAVTLQTDSLWLPFASVWPVLLVGAGAIMLFAHKHGGSSNEATEMRKEEEEPA